MFCSSKTKAKKLTSVLHVQNLFVCFANQTQQFLFCRSSYRRRLAYTILLFILFLHILTRASLLALPKSIFLTDKSDSYTRMLQMNPLRLRPTVSIFVQFFSSPVQPLPHIKVSGKNQSPKCIFLKTFSSVEVFLLKRLHVTGSYTSRRVCSHKRQHRFRSPLRFRLDGQKRFKNTRCGCPTPIFINVKNLHFKQKRILVDGA